MLCKISNTASLHDIVPMIGYFYPAAVIYKLPEYMGNLC